MARPGRFLAFQQVTLTSAHGYPLTPSEHPVSYAGAALRPSAQMVRAGDALSVPFRGMSALLMPLQLL